MSQDYTSKTLRGHPFPPGIDLRGACFRRATLCGVSFRDLDLSDADFAGADIRGANFTGATLCRTDFTNARAGRRLRHALQLSLVVGGGSAIPMIAALYGATLLAEMLLEANGQRSVLPVLAFGAAFALVFFLVGNALLLIRHEVTVRETIRRTLSFAGGIVVFGLVAFPFLAAGFTASACAVTVMLAVAAIGVALGAVAGTGAVVCAVAGAVAGVLWFGRALFPRVDADVSALFFAGVVVLAAYFAWKVHQEDERFGVVRRFGLSMGVMGGTRFHRANLTGARFEGASLAHSNFQDAVLTRVSWRGARRLEHAYVEGSLLAVRTVRELLVKGQGAGRSLVACDLRGVNLEHADLAGANLELANLSEACLRGADLRNANLTECQAVGTDFTGATLTGACLQAWNMDHSTKLTDVICDYVFLREHEDEHGNRERRPHDPDRVFAPGDFEQLYTEIVDTLQILFRNGVDPTALREALVELGREHAGIGWESIRAMERKGGDVLVTVDVPPEADKAMLERELRSAYERLRQLEAENRHLLAMAERTHALAMTLATRPVQVNQILGEGTDVSQHKDYGRSMRIGNIGGDLHASGQAMHQGDIQGTATASTNVGTAPLSQEQWQKDIEMLMAALAEHMDALEEEVWRATMTIFKKLHALDMDGKTGEQALATVEQTLDTGEKSTLRRAWTELGKSTRSILEDMTAAGIFSALFSG